MVNLVKEKWNNKIFEVVLGALKEEGGTRAYKIKVGGQNTLPFLFEEGDIPNKPAIALEIWDTKPHDWPSGLTDCYKDVFDDPLAWAEKCVKEYKAELLCVRLQGAHPDFKDKTPEEEAKFIKNLLNTVGVPLIIVGCGDDSKDNQVLPLCSEVSKNERCLIGEATPDNYKTLVMSVLADGHNIIAQSPIDVNIAKQLNILISELGLPLERIVINPTIGALGYGLEYAYSIMERIRLASLAGDRTLSSPFICFVGQEVWKSKEAKETPKRGVYWEITTSLALLQAGADILVMRHPQSQKSINLYINELMENS